MQQEGRSGSEDAVGRGERPIARPTGATTARLVAAGLATAAAVLAGVPAAHADPALGPAGQDAVAKAPPTGERPYSERVVPPAGTPRRGVVLLLHRGGWHRSPQATKDLRPTAERVAALGFIVRATDYADHHAGLADILRAYDRLRRHHPRKPVCTYGESAGGHLALLVAVLRPVRCVIADAAPTDLEAFRPVVPGVEGGTWQRIREAFGTDASTLALWSPISYADDYRAAGTRLLLGYSDADTIVPASQALALRGATAHNVRVVDGPADTSPQERFVHTYASRASLRRYHAVQARVLRAAATRPGGRRSARG